MIKFTILSIIIKTISTLRACPNMFAGLHLYRVSWLASISLLSIHNNRGTFRACPDMVVRLHFLNQSLTSVTFQIFHWFTLTLPTRLSLKTEYTLDSKFNLVSGCLYHYIVWLAHASVTYCFWWQNTTPFASKLLHSLLHTQATRKIWTGCVGGNMKEMDAYTIWNRDKRFLRV